MNQILLQPTDVLFFRDGRPMGGSSTGHGAAWPLPSVTNAALHAALWRSGLAVEARAHSRKSSSERSSATERFGSLTTAGPFPVFSEGDTERWLFPRPLDSSYESESDTTTGQSGVRLTHAPTLPVSGSSSSCPLPLAPATLVPPTKNQPCPWWSRDTWSLYLGSDDRSEPSNLRGAFNDTDFSDSEAAIGIGIDPLSGTQDGKSIYSAHYLRLREGWNLGLLAETADKTDVRGVRSDLIRTLLDEHSQLMVGGQQRHCTAKKTALRANQRLPLPVGLSDGFPMSRAVKGEEPKHFVKWVLLTPAIFPEIKASRSANGAATLPHSGGWLPTWITDDASFQVQLRPPVKPRDLATESRAEYRSRIRNQDPIRARLLAALVGKPLPVTGWSLGTPDLTSVGETEAAQRSEGAKPTHFAVPAGSVYYFACDSADAAAELAAALNWHGGETPGETLGSRIRNRRSTLLGEKGFGLGVCAGWEPIEHSVP